jgi:hypothetical protein
MTETRGFLALRLDDQRLLATARLARRLADHIDEFRFVGHDGLLAKGLSPQKPNLRLAA